MRKAFSRQLRLDGGCVMDVAVNLNCRDEIIPILMALKHIYATPQLRDDILKMIEKDVLGDGKADRGRNGLDYWHILVLAAIRLGCHLDYDKLQDLAENHRTLRGLMAVGDFDETSFTWKRIRDNVCLLTPATIDSINQLIVGAGHQLRPDAIESVRADSFVIETNIHWPSESSLIRDGITKLLTLCEPLAKTLDVPGWRQSEHLLKKVQYQARDIDRIASKKGPNYHLKLKTLYKKLLKRSGQILEKVREVQTALLILDGPASPSPQSIEIRTFVENTERVRDTARRRVLMGEKVPNSDKLFSLFELHTQLYKRGKAGDPVQFGRLTLVCEDAAGFIIHHYLMPRESADRDVVIAQARVIQAKYQNRIKKLSFDRGFHTPDNQRELAKIVDEPCLPKPGHKQAAEQAREASVTFHESRRRHAGVESAIGALQAGNGLKRCPDKTEVGFERYIALGILGRNLQVLGRLLIASEDANCEAAKTRRAG